MENRPLPLAAYLIFLLLPAFAVQAADEIGSPEQRADWEQRLQKAQALSAESRAQEDEAAKIRAAKDGECPKRFQVNACLRENLNEYTQASRRAKRIENEGLAIERGVRKEQLKEKDAHLQADAQRRQEALPEREVSAAKARQRVEEREARVRAGKAAKAEAGLQRKAAQAEKLRQRQAAHDARVAEKMQKAQNGAAAK